jgi:protein-L-isoaspartate(D-aspartate) O-methyltransferase
MVEQLRRQGIHDERVLAAMRRIPRHRFVEESYWSFAYANHPLPIDAGQTISQPYIVALMTASLCPKPHERILEIGTGSGYQTAILAELASEVYSVERVAGLAEVAQRRLKEFHYSNIHFCVGDGTVGWPEFAPYDGIIATGSLPQPPPALQGQSADPGRMVLPLGDRELQRLTLLQLAAGDWRTEEICYCNFLPLVGREGWPEGDTERH